MANWHRGRPLREALEVTTMHLENSIKGNAERSPVMAAFGVGLAGLMVIAFATTGAVHHLVAAFAFAAMAPVWYLLPRSLLTRPIGARLKQRFPRWAQLLTGTGLALLFISLGLRWVA
jgi:hypothetical protein